MNIEGIGKEAVDLFYREGLVNSPADLYELTPGQISHLDRMGERMAENILSGIDKSRSVPFSRVLFALGIRFVGESVASLLTGHFGTMDALRNATLEDLLQVPDVGERIAQSVIEYFADPKQCAIVDRLAEAGLQMQQAVIEQRNTALAGKNIVVSGVFALHSREEYKQLIEQLDELQKQKPVIVCGDFNVAHQPIDLARPKPNEGKHGYTVEERAGFDGYMQHGFIDSFRHLHPTTIKYSWWSHWGNARANNVGWRIDYFLISNQLKARLKSADIYPDVEGSDHCPISVEIV